MRARSRWVTNVLLAVGATVVTLAVVELAARVAVRRRGGGREQDERVRYMQPDPRLGWRKRPGAHVTYRRREYTVEVSINSTGLRDPERPLAKPPGVYRILAVGDSMVEGYSVRMERTVSQSLEHSLAPRCAVEVLNGGTAGYSTDQEYLFYLDDGHRYDPDVVVLFVHHNDIMANTWSNYWGTPKPLLRMSGAAPVIANFPVPPPTVRAAVPSAGPLPIRGSAAVTWLKERLLLGAPRAYNRLALLGLWAPVGGDTIEPGDQMRVYKRRWQQPVEEGWTLTAAILTAFAREAAARQTRFLVAYVPGRFEVSDRDWELTQVHFGLAAGLWDRGLVRERLQTIGRSAAFPVLALTPALREADHGLLGEPYFLWDGHWNERGHAAAARALEAWLMAQGWLPPACAGRAARRAPSG
jgi:lysophospholipase L1-like esterase